MARFTRRLVLATLVVSVSHICNSLQAADSPEQEAVKALRRAATNIQFNKDETVRLVRLSKPSVTDDSLAHLKLFTEIDYLAVVCPQVTDAGLSNISGLANLDTLFISNTQISDEGLAILKDLVKLQRLYLAGTNITDAGLVHLPHLANLRTLSLAETRITDAGLQHLKSLENLDALVLNDTKITDEGLKHLAELPNLRALRIARTKVTGKGLVHLKSLSKLEHVDLTGAPVTVDSLVNAGELKGLKRLSLYQTEFADDEFEKLRQSLTKTQIFPLARRRRDVTSSPKTADPNVSVAEESPILNPAKARFTTGNETPDFQRHVLPLLGRLGCNGRACHGSFQGQGGFRLSMFGYDFELDHNNLTKGEHPRVDVKKPEQSLILNKPTSEDDHEGGLRYEKGGWEYHLLRRWIAGGAKSVADDAAQFVRLEVTPAEIVFGKVGNTTQLQAVAVWSDGTREDVTCLTRFESNDESVAEVTKDGLVRSMGKGDTYVISFYDNGIASTQVLLPVSDQTGDRYPDIPTPTNTDEHVVAKLSKLGIVPSELSTDEEFLRRVSLDLIGTLPTPTQMIQFVADKSPDKRAKKIDVLLEHPAYVTWWTTRLCDLTGSNAGYLGNTDMARPVANQWRAWIERRVQDNVGWDKIVEGIILATSRKPGQTYEEFVVEQSAYTARDKRADFTALDNSMPHYWFRDNQRLPKDKALTFGYTFLGVRLQCAECHKHPYDQWSQQDFQQFTEFFTRIQTGIPPSAVESHDQLRAMLAVPVKLNTAALRRQSYLRIAAEGRPIPWKEVYIAPPKGSKPAKLLGGEEVNIAEYDDPRVPLMNWLKDSKNLYFARAFVNRIWANYFNVGIIDPPDDLNQANPPSNKQLLDWLAREFVANGYDMKWLHRTITSSRTYQLSWRPSETNRTDERNFSHAIVRRLPAEIAVDAIIQATANDIRISGIAKDVTKRKIGQHPTSYQARAIDFSLLIFGKPLRTTTCDCERASNPTLLQALYIRNDHELLDMLQRRDGWLFELANEMGQTLSSEVTGQKDLKPKKVSEVKHAEPETVDELIRSAYLRTVGRQPREDELANCRTHVTESENTVEGLRNIMWALLNTQEFITNH